MKDFLFGTATSATQIEGGYDQDGKGLSVWDEYSRKGLIFNGQTCFKACDSYNRMEEDIALLKELGVNAYRFSLAWTRIQPKGYGKINPKGIAYYNGLIDRLLKNGIKPFVTLFHWDMPVELAEQGGFSNPTIVERFAEYAKIVAENFGDRVDSFTVFNEAASIIDFMYLHPVGANCPAKSVQEAFEGLHNLLLCNAAATDALRKYSKLPVKVGMVNCTDIKTPKNPEYEELAKKETFAPHWLLGNTTFWDPIVFGKYNEDLIEKFRIDLSFVKEGDMERIACKPDFMGLNVYVGERIEPDGKGGIKISTPPVNATYGDMSGDIFGSADSMYYGTKFMQERYGLPIYITENGCSMPDWKDMNGEILDGCRSDYIRRYLGELMRAKKEGIDIRGYFVWSLMDNFEWSSGYSRRFGLVYVDFETFERTKKHSFYTYNELIKIYKTTS